LENFVSSTLNGERGGSPLIGENTWANNRKESRPAPKKGEGREITDEIAS